jgi:chemotaxis protein MotB
VEIPNRVQVEGHTDNLPIEEGSTIARRYPSNWELSGQRAINVLKSLASLGVEEGRLAAVARGDTRPMVSNDTPEGRAYNRRVEIVILP